MFDSKEPYVSNAQSKAALPSIVAFLVACIFSMHYLIAKKILMSVPPESLAAARGLLGGITLTVVYRVNFLKLLKGPHAEYLLLVTIFGFGLNQWLL
ncbi:MAG: hypothetical protein NTV34_16975, partial [Proteobacteria bacterium]|nr:hypothetical protein [Pseudomonadota bacterium]